MMLSRRQALQRPFTAGRPRPVAVRRPVSAPAVKLYTNPGSRGKIAEWCV